MDILKSIDPYVFVWHLPWLFSLQIPFLLHSLCHFSLRILIPHILSFYVYSILCVCVWCMHACAHMCKHASLYACVCGVAHALCCVDVCKSSCRGQKRMLHHHSFTDFFEVWLSLNWRFGVSIRLAGSKLFGSTSLIPTVKATDTYNHALIFLWVLEIWTYVLMHAEQVFLPTESSHQSPNPLFSVFIICSICFNLYVLVFPAFSNPSTFSSATSNPLKPYT